MSTCFIWIPIAVWVVSMIGWIVAGEVETIYGVAAIGCSVGMGLVAAFPPFPALSPALFVLAVAMVVFYPFVRAAANRRALATIEIEQLSKFYDMLQEKPDNWPVMLRLAEILYRRGLPGPALALADRALASMPQTLFRSEHNMVATWRLEVGQAGDLGRPLACLHCGAPNPPGGIHCQKCGAPYLIDLARGRWLGKNTAQQVVVAWIGLGIAFVGIPLAARTSTASPMLAIALIVLQVALGGLLVYKAYIAGGAHEAA
ncbi:MAG: zinc ribbon domain-containing protein [Armatimonadetes bacterium]|nr:zinc ribbon domain-containing protein [Armatimonadota bacterium]